MLQPIGSQRVRHDWVTEQQQRHRGLPYGSDGEGSACSVRDPGLIPGQGRSPGAGNGYLLHYACLENPIDRGAWQATVHLVTKSQTGLNY